MASRPPETAGQYLEAMIRAYSQATGYRDQAVVRLSYVDQGQASSDESPLAVAFDRGSASLRVRAYQVDVACRQGQLRARVIDRASDNFDNQCVEARCGSPLKLESLYRDPVLADLLSHGMARFPIQLELLMAEQPLDYFAASGVAKQLLEIETVDGHSCQAVAVGEGAEQFRFWIDTESFLLRRLDYPTDELARTAAVGEIRLTAEFKDAAWEADPQRFQLQCPPDATVVQYFVPPPQPLPTDLYGKTPEPFQFEQLDGVVTAEQLKGKPTVLVWFADHLACRAALEQLQLVRRRWGEDRLNMLAVSTEPAAADNAQLQRLLDAWRIDLPAARDTQAFGRDVFDVPNLPTLVVLDSAGRLQVYDVGFNENLPEELDLVLSMLEQGQDVAAEVVRQSRNERAAYQQDLVAAGAKGVDVRFPVAEKSEPEQLNLELDWESVELKQPGNVVAYRDAGGAVELAALDGMRTVAVLDGAGRVQSTRPLALPPEVGVSLLRTSSAAAGARRYLLSAVGGQQAFLFDEQWELQASHPADPLHDGILDAVLLDTGDQLRMLIGYREAGLHAADASGARLWVSRDCDTPNSIDVVETAEGPRILAADPAGMVYVFTPEGVRSGGPLRAAGLPMYEIHAGRFEDQAAAGAALCGVTFDALGRRVAVGMDLSLGELWRRALPGGSFAYPVQWVASGLLLNQPHWVMAGTDGSLHLIASDGSLQESFNYGESIRGLAVTPEQRLLVATESGLRCWKITR